MGEVPKKIMSYVYSKIRDEQNKVGVHIEYASKNELDREERSTFRSQLREYVKKGFKNNDIIDIVRNIREITKELDEQFLKVSIGTDDYMEYVHYENGNVELCGIYKKIWDDEISLVSSSKGINITIKKDGVVLDDEDKMDQIDREILEFYKKIIVLYNMSQNKTNENIKTKKLTK